MLVYMTAAMQYSQTVLRILAINLLLPPIIMKKPLFQTANRYMNAEQRRRDFEERMAQRRAERDSQREQRSRESKKKLDQIQQDAMKEVLGVTQQQWKIIKPKYEKVETLLAQARVSIGIGVYITGSSGGTGGFTQSGSSGGGSGGAYGGGFARGGSRFGGSAGRTYGGSYGDRSATRGSEPQSSEETAQ